MAASSLISLAVVCSVNQRHQHPVVFGLCSCLWSVLGLFVASMIYVSVLKRWFLRGVFRASKEVFVSRTLSQCLPRIYPKLFEKNPTSYLLRTKSYQQFFQAVCCSLLAVHLCLTNSKYLPAELNHWLTAFTYLTLVAIKKPLQTFFEPCLAADRSGQGQGCGDGKPRYEFTY